MSPWEENEEELAENIGVRDIEIMLESRY